MSNSVRLDSVLGGIILGLARERHLLANEYATRARSSQKNRQNGIIAFHVLLDTIDEKVMLIHVYLHTGGTTIEVKQGLRAMLHKND